MVEVREASEHDAAPLVGLLGQLGYPSTLGGLRAALGAEPRTGLLVAEDGGTVIGAVAVHVRRHVQLRAECASIDVLIVDEGHRSRGVGSALLAAAAGWAGAQGADRLELNSALDRTDALRFYERHGFEVVSHHLRRALPRTPGAGDASISVRPLRLDEVHVRIDYFHGATDQFLARLGVDRARLPSPEEWHAWYREDYARPIEERRNHAVAWELDRRVVGFSSTDRIAFGREAFMHLHLLDAEHRRRGLGTQFVRLSARYFLDVLRLERLFCQPNAFNQAPNRTLQRAGFRYLFTHHTTPGPINSPQPVTRWVLDAHPAGTPSGSGG